MIASTTKYANSEQMAKITQNRAIYSTKKFTTMLTKCSYLVRLFWFRQSADSSFEQASSRPWFDLAKRLNLAWQLGTCDHHILALVKQGWLFDKVLSFTTVFCSKYENLHWKVLKFYQNNKSFCLIPQMRIVNMTE